MGGPPSALNVLLVCLVPVRFDRLSYHGYGRDTTPNLDAFAAGATDFLSAYATAPWTPPSFSSVLTGLYPWNNGVMGPGRLGPGHRTIGDHLRAHGYRTAAVVTSHHTGRHRGFDRGFDEFDEVAVDLRDRGSVAATAAATAYLTVAAEDPRPFFLTVHYHELHHPYLPPRGHRGRYTKMKLVRGNSDLRRLARDPHRYMLDNPSAETLGLLSDLYDDELAYLDREHLGPLLDHVRDLGLLDRTVVVVVSLHGDSLGEHGLLSHSAQLYEPTVHVPMIIRHPTDGHGTRVADLVQLTDVLPTLAHLLGVDLPARLDGWPVRAFAPRSPRRTFVAAQWSSSKAQRWARRVDGNAAYTDFVARLAAEQLMVRAGRFKYVSAPVEELFDLAADPGELINVLDHHPRQAAALRTQLDRLVSSRVSVTPAARPPPDVARDLRRMGYTS